MEQCGISPPYRLHRKFYHYCSNQRLLLVNVPVFLCHHLFLRHRWKHRPQLFLSLRQTSKQFPLPRVSFQQHCDLLSRSRFCSLRLFNAVVSWTIFVQNLLLSGSTVTSTAINPRSSLHLSWLFSIIQSKFSSLFLNIVCVWHLL